MLKNIKINTQFIAIVLLVFAGSTGINESSYAIVKESDEPMYICHCGAGIGPACIPTDVQANGQEAMEKYCKNDITYRARDGSTHYANCDLAKEKQCIDNSE